jgi:CRISPR-associated protein Csm5
MGIIEEKIKESREKLGVKIPCSLEILSPVHIGSGVKLAKDIDFISSNQTTKIIKQGTLLRYLENNEDELKRFNEGNYQLSKLKNIPDSKTYYMETNSRYIFEYERNGFGKPYVPGSSLKGALRSIIISDMMQKLGTEKKEIFLNNITSNNAQRASESLLKELLGKNSNYNLFRSIKIFDAQFQEDDIDLEKCFILNLKNNAGTEFGWKNVPRRCTTDKIREATPIFYEGLKAGAKAGFSFSIDEFLLNNDIAKAELKFNYSGLTFKSISKTINAYSRNKLPKEISFLRQINNTRLFDNIIKELETVIGLIPKLDSVQDEKEFILRISWGTGWKNMTGDFLPEDWLAKFRQKYRLGRDNMPFPKTRKIIFDDELPKFLTGFVKIKFNDIVSHPHHAEVNENINPIIDESDWASKLGANFKVRNKKNK